MSRSYPYFKYDASSGRQSSACLEADAAFRTCEVQDRIVTSEFVMRKDGTSGFGKFRLEMNRSCFFQRVLSLPVSQRHSCTTITNGQRVLLYLDCEFEPRLPTDTSEVIQSLAQTAIQFVNEVFAAAYPGQSLFSEHFWIFGATTDSKISLHIHADPNLANVVWLNPGELTIFMKQHVKPELIRRYNEGDASVQLLIREAMNNNKTELKTFIDFNVYNSKTQNVKLPLCSKPGKAIMQLLYKPLIAAGASDIEQLNVGMITVPRLSDSINHGLPLLVNSFTLPRTSQQRIRPSMKYISVDDPRRHCLLEQLREHVGELAQFTQVSIGDKAISGIFAVGSARCGNIGRPHKGNRTKFFGEYNGVSVILKITCFDNSCSEWSQVINIIDTEVIQLLFPARATVNVNTHEVSEQHRELDLSVWTPEWQTSENMSNFGLPLSDEKVTSSFASRYILPEVDDPSLEETYNNIFSHPTVVLRSPMNTGKTTALTYHINRMLQHNKAARILVVVPRISLAQTLVEAWKHLEFACYLDHADRSSLQRQSRLVIVIDSLPKLMAANSTKVAHWDFVAFDEIETCLKAFSASHLKSREAVWSAFGFITTSATNVLTMDADVSERCLSVLSHFRSANGRVHVVKNTYRNDANQYVFLGSPGAFYLVLEYVLQMGYKVVIATNSLAEARTMEHEIGSLFRDSSLKVRLYSGESSAAQKRELARCNEYWCAYDVVIYTPVVGCGVDFNPLEPYFDVLMVYGTTTSCPAREMMQMSGRVRKLKMQRVYVFLEHTAKEPNATIVDIKLHKDYLLENWFQLPHDTASERSLLKHYFAPNGGSSFMDIAYLQLYTWNQRESEMSRCWFAALYFHAVKDRNASYEFLDHSNVKEGQRRCRSAATATTSSFQTRVDSLSQHSIPSHQVAVDHSNTSNSVINTAQILLMTSHYPLKMVNPFSGSSMSADMQKQWALFISLYGSKTVISRFPNVITTLNCMKAIRDTPTHIASVLVHQSDDSKYMKLLLCKLLLHVMGFYRHDVNASTCMYPTLENVTIGHFSDFSIMTETERATALAVEALADQTSLFSVCTPSSKDIEQRLEHQNGSNMLYSLQPHLVKYFGVCIGSKATGCIKTSSVTKTLRSVLQQLIGDLLTSNSKNTVVVSHSSKRTKVNIWSLNKDGQLMSWLELVHAKMVNDNDQSEMRANVQQAINAWKPEFHWSVLTGVDQLHASVDVKTKWSPSNMSTSADAQNKRRSNQQAVAVKRTLKQSSALSDDDDDEQVTRQNHKKSKLSVHEDAMNV